MDKKKLLHDAQNSFTKTFNSAPYSSMRMIYFLVQLSGKKLTDFLQNPGILNQVSKQTIQNAITDPRMQRQFDATWKMSAGRCTSFCIWVASDLEMHFDSGRSSTPFDFKFYNVKTSEDAPAGHRLALCLNTGLLVDSHLFNGPQFLDEAGSEYTLLEEDGLQTSWYKLEGGTTTFAQTNGKHKVSSKPISREEAQLICLSELVSRPTPLCYFRSHDNGHTRYYGMIQWVLDQPKPGKTAKPAKLKLSNSKDTMRKHNIEIVIQWGDKKGTMQTEWESFELLMEFVFYGGASRKGSTEAKHAMQTDPALVEDAGTGGPYGYHQWTSAGDNGVNSEFWVAATSIWGFPAVSKREGLPAGFWEEACTRARSRTGKFDGHL